jgi:purine-cytosine permease-like protein
MTVYCVGSANVGAVAGQTHAVTTRSVFGTIGSSVVSVLLVIDGMGFYLFYVLFIVDGIVTPLVGTVPAAAIVTAFLAFAMIVNNYFGFTGLQRFAQYVAAPVILLWGAYAFIRTITTVSGATIDAIPALPDGAAPQTILFAAGAMIGLSTWGNEPDIFRYAKSGRTSGWNIPTLAISYFLGAFVFPIMGYLIASLVNDPDQGVGIGYLVQFTTFSVSAVMLVVLIVNQWAVQDGNLYIAINGAQNLLSRIPGYRRQYTVIGLGAIAAGLTFILPDLQQTFNIVTGIGAVTVPVASTIMAMDLFIVPRLFGLRRPMHRVPRWNELAAANWPAIIALVLGSGIGGYTAGVIPGIPGFQSTYIGFPALQAWVIGAVSYLAMVAVVAHNPRAKEILGYARIGDGVAEAPAQPVPATA